MKIGKLHIRPTRRGWTILALLALLASSYTADAVASVGRVRAGVTAGSLQLGGKTKDQARIDLERRAELLVSEPIELFADDHKMTIQPTEIGFDPDVAGTLDDAVGVGRRGNFLVRSWHRLRALFASTNVGWESTHDAKTAKLLVSEFASRIDTEGHEAGIEARGAKFVAVGAVPGRRLDHDRTVGAIVESLESWPRRSMEVPVSVRHRRTTIDDAREAAKVANRWTRGPLMLVAPDSSRHSLPPEELAKMIDAVPRKRGGDWILQTRFSPELVEGVLAEKMKPFEREAKSASFAVNGAVASVVAGQAGRRFDAKATAERLADTADRESNREMEAAFKDSEPELTTDEAKDLNITELVSSFTTNHPCCAPRVSNIHKIADTVDGAIVKPGASFSLNGYVGPRTVEKGYVLAPMIFDGEFRDDVGGGVSQFATTMFNAIFFGGYRFNTYKAHSYYISRYPAGREATVSWPNPDLAFTNNSSAGVLIKAFYSSTSITVSFYGDKEGKTVTAEAGPRTNPTQPGEQRRTNPALPPGAERVMQGGGPGFDIVVMRIIRKDGDETSQRFFTRYKAEPRIIEVGPKPEPSPSPTPSGSPSPSESPRQPRRPGTTPTPQPPPGGSPAP
jgi:vancomycin resistance protein YoaR